MENLTGGFPEVVELAGKTAVVTGWPRRAGVAGRMLTARHATFLNSEKEVFEAVEVAMVCSTRTCATKVMATPVAR